MPGFCGECGFALDKDYNFCPSCGSKIESFPASGRDVDKPENEKTAVTVCSNCGEENPVGLDACEACGAALAGAIKKEIIKKELKNSSVDERKIESKKQVRQQSKKKHKQVETVNKQKSNAKELNNKFIFGIAGGIIAIVILILFISGVFDSTSTTVNAPDQQTGSGINLNNMNAIADLEKKIAANPEDMQSVLDLAHLKYDSGLFEKAITNYQKYLGKNPSDADARIDLGVCYYNLNNFDKALAEMSKALEYSPKHQIGHLNLGIVNLSAGNLQKAKEWFQKTVELDPNSSAGQRAQELLTSH